MADSLHFHRHWTDLSQLKKSTDMWYFYQYTGRFLKKSGSIFCHSGSSRIAME